MSRRAISQMASLPGEYIGATGNHYRFKEFFQIRPHLGRVWLATSGRNQFVLKDIPESIFFHFNKEIKPRLAHAPYIRLPCDHIPGQRILVYQYLTYDFLRLVQKRIPIRSRKKILKDSLRGIAELHDRDVVHLDIKPDNIVVDTTQDENYHIIERVQITDLENAAYLPSGRCIRGMLAGNYNWRSPEAHFKERLNKPNDMFSFGITCIYAMLGRVIFGPDEDFRKHQSQGVLPTLIRLQRQVSYFGDQEGVDGLLRHLSDDDTSCEVLQMLWEERFDENIPYKSFYDWPEVSDPEFKDFIKSLTSLAPNRRVTAKQALDHPWSALDDLAHSALLIFKF
ncbi:calcium/calmodulin dependent protein kinase, putative [Paecilomyces variotii No. 5]|uniref:Calcium/calmodulin dependent protein kinase, putative n=1 Tax=Byssochlamys spectabilis (strain No. 5 / NBRC 109023) TaxID=1356009 RepID=V5I1B3_BYSSN|nr:calcium/calmodulin dependent protein kinase, putative [Paecilomyces variotii No. 5]